MTAEVMNDMDVLMEDTNRKVFFTDVPRGTLKQKPPVTRKPAANFAEALQNFGTDLQNTLLFNDLASIACGGGTKDVYEDEEEKTSEDLPAQTLSPVDAKKSAQRRGLMSAETSVVSDDSDCKEEMDVEQEEELYGTMNRVHDGVVGGWANVIENVTGKSGWAIDDVAESAGELAYEMKDFAEFAIDEAQVFAHDVGADNFARYAGNVVGLEDGHFEKLNKEMRGERRVKARNGYVPQSRVHIDKNGHRIPLPYPETETMQESEEEITSRNKCKGPPALRKQRKYDEQLMKARKQAEVEAAYREACQLEEQRIRDEYKKKVMEHTNEYEKLVTPARAGKRVNVNLQYDRYNN